MAISLKTISPSFSGDSASRHTRQAGGAGGKQRGRGANTNRWGTQKAGRKTSAQSAIALERIRADPALWRYGAAGRDHGGVDLSWFKRAGKRDAARAAREQSFMELVFVHWEPAHRYALRLTGNAAEASDIIQDALLRAFEAFERTREDTQWRPWLFTIVRNTFISKVRKQSRETSLDEPGRAWAEPGAEPDDAAPPIDWRTLRGAEAAFEDEILKALLELPEHQRSAVILCDIEGFDYDTIATIVDCPVGTVRSRIHHARRRLREALSIYADSKGYRHAERA
jgi:RNA polymerase sigma-70 factor, ECF subfamily